MTLFSESDLNAKVTEMESAPMPAPADRRQLRLPTGAARFVEASRESVTRLSALAWSMQIALIQQSCAMRLELLKGRRGTDRTACPWERLTPCDQACRCHGMRTVTIFFLRSHYEHLAAEIVLCARPASMSRRPK
jgi:hypothetical protein